MSWVWVAVGGAVGAPLRYLTDHLVRARYGGEFPWGTFSVNVVGSLVLGLVTGAVTGGVAGPQVQLLLGTGLCGALTTYSTFGWETLRLLERGRGGLAAANALASCAAALGAYAVGLAAARALVG